MPTISYKLSLGILKNTAHQDLLVPPSTSSLVSTFRSRENGSLSCSFSPRSCYIQRSSKEVHASTSITNYALENIWPAVNNIVHSVFGFGEYLDDRASVVEASNSIVLKWITAIISNKLQVSLEDVSLEAKLEHMVFTGGHSDSNFRMVESLMDIEDLFSLIIHPNYIDTLASYSVRELSDVIESQYLISIKELQSTFFNRSYNCNMFLMEKMLQSAISKVLIQNGKEPLPLDLKLSSCQPTPRLLKESLQDLKEKFGVELDYATFKESTIRAIAKSIISNYKF